MARFRNPGEPFEVRRSNGALILVRDHRLANGGVATTSMDISSLREAEVRLCDAIESSDQGFVLFDAEGRLLLRNARMEKIAQM